MHPKPHNDWYSLELLLEHHTPGVLTTAIEQFGIQVIDEVGRVVSASEGAVDNRFTRQFAISLLKDRYAELQNPGPEYSWQAERWDTEPHPTHFFGWSRGYLPELSANGPIIIPGERDTEVPWTERAAEEFIAEKNTAGSYRKAADIHNVTRQRYTEVYNKVVYGRKIGR